jgi:hypothetical protein
VFGVSGQNQEKARQDIEFRTSVFTVNTQRLLSVFLVNLPIPSSVFLVRSFGVSG